MFKPIADRSNVTAYVILNRNDVHVANVQFLYGSGGTVYCEAHQFGDATARSLATAIKNNRVSAKHVERIESCANYCSTPESKRRYAERELFGHQKGRAGGYGYDKATAALSGMIIDGHTMANHCGHVPEADRARARLFAAYEKTESPDYTEWSAKARKIGARFANYGHGKNGNAGSLYFSSGLERLTDLGYRVIGAV